ncbi:MAG: membrane protein FdrA [Chloroflexi bacterium ADurb.Bin325]|nr:MAG: membrane protein FdrA [Chloroflexi bacterium ADurb.Bin325]
MPILTRIRAEYHDSIILMQVAAALLDLPGVEDAAVVMGTPANQEIVAGAGLLTPEVAAARPDDLVIVVRAADEAAGQAALAQAQEILARRGPRTETTAARPKSLAAALHAAPDANLVVISVAGRYAGREARAALDAGRHVLLFSDNVPLEDEIGLKQLAVSKGLLCMGPDAGTAIINGVALGFANAVPRGRVGLVSAAGTGLQAVTTGLARRGAGVSQAIGAGGRDLSEAVGGLMMLQGLQMLQADPQTEVIVLISKPPAPSVAAKVLAAISPAKPTVVCFLGADPGPIEAAGALPATTLAQAAAGAAALAAGGDYYGPLAEMAEASKALIPLAEAARGLLRPGQRSLRGLFTGGTFCYEAQALLQGLPEPVYSNAPLDKARKLEHVVTHPSTDGSEQQALSRPPAQDAVNPPHTTKHPERRPHEVRTQSKDATVVHTIIDLGEDEFTQGRLHPMIDPALRNRRIVEEARDPATAVILLDYVLGYGAHPDPAGASLDALRAAQRVAAEDGRQIVFIASVCGAEADPQPLSEQEAKLRAAGVIVLPDNAAAARLAGLVVALAGNAFENG